MPMTFSALVSVALAPVALITPTAILLGNFTTKYTGITGQMRDLTAEYRTLTPGHPRRANLRIQLHIFHRRAAAMWASSIILLLAVLCFVTTVLAAVFVEQAQQLGLAGIVAMIIGLTLIVVAGGVELYEIRLARLSLAGELVDIFEGYEEKND